MSEAKPTTYHGNCHCGNIKYTATLPDALAPEGSGKINRCNCSICTKAGIGLPPSPVHPLSLLPTHPAQATSSSTRSAKT